MHVKTEHWDPIIIFLLSQRLPGSTINNWEQQREVNDVPTLDQLMTFVQGRARGRMYATQTDNTKSNPKTGQSSDRNAFSVRARAPYSSQQGEGAVATQNNNQGPKKEPPTQGVDSNRAETKRGPSCHMCNEGHPIYRCPTFLSLQLTKRGEMADQLGLCRNCLRRHGKNECTFRACVRCPEQMHNSTLCPNRATPAKVNQIQSNDHSAPKKRRTGKKRPASPINAA